MSLGLASQMFLEPALDVLWKRICGMEPLLSVLPETTLVNGQKMFLRPIAPSSWDRLQFYTSRVREFDDWERFKKQSVHDSVYAYLGQEKPIFPNLRMLRLTGHRLCNSDSFAFFLNTGLQAVLWLCDPLESPVDAGSNLGPSLALLVSKSPGLMSLTLSQYTYSGLSHSLSCLRDLEKLSVIFLPHLEMDSIQAIALLPKLTDLHLALPAGILVHYTGVESGFPSLTKIWLSGSTFDLREFLAVARPKALRNLTIDWNFEPIANQSPLADIAAITHFLPFFPSLRKLEMNGDALSSLTKDLDEQQLWSIFEPLLELKRLENLFYNIPLPVSDQKTVRIACAWPNLRDLYLDSPGGLSSLESLVHFARHCPDLESLYYPIQLRPTIPSTIPPTLSPHPLHTFETRGEANVMNAPAIALGLHQIFPNLVTVEGDGDGWTLVQEILDSFIFIWKQNRSFEE
ncbi:hypothetical protein BDP27DRAFT_1365997 [Rhodocollybia butyracea]|uniref:Uncharacterized protein n=1 Tax=Rhodocollybia butyracea TaxID=206335 RepID=A0A9P5PNX3_9AGAR|nr:hypothetical protein BDP27DRAFT_1365997 [Rhodocollybia butyracea]